MTYHRIQLAALLLLGVLIAPATQATTAFPEQITLESQQLQRIGFGSARYAGIVHVYDAALYAPLHNTAAGILDAATPKRLEILYHRPIEATLMVEAAQHVLERQHGTQTLERWQPSIDRLHAAYRDVAAGDRFALAMSPEHGLWLEFNGREVVRIDDPELGRLYFGIWLGDPPLSAKLRDALLPSGCCQVDAVD